MTEWMQFRDLMPVAKKWVYLDHSAVGPLPGPTRDAIRNWLEDATINGDVHWPEWSRQVNELRTRTAKMINAAENEIALVPSTTAGINYVAEGFPWKAGDNVVTLANEFPSNLFPWLHLQDRGVEVRQVAVPNGGDRAGIVDLKQIDELCDERTRIVTVSWVGFASGYRLAVDDVCEIAHRHGALVMLDAIQGLGVYPLDVRNTPVDFVSADGHKWMLGPEGAGVFYIREQNLERLRPVGVGWASVKSPFDFASPKFEIRNAASRYEGGALNTAGFIGLSASVDLLTKFGTGPDRSLVGERVIQIADYAVDKLRSIGASVLCPHADGHQSGIVTFSMDGLSPDGIRNGFRDAGIVVSCRGGGIRLSPHAYVSESDIDKLVDVIGHLKVTAR